MTPYGAWLAGFAAAAYPCPSQRPDGPLGESWDAGWQAGAAKDQEAADLEMLAEWAWSPA